MNQRNQTGSAATAEQVEDAQALSMGPALDFLRQLWRLNHALELVSSQMGQTLGVTAQQRIFLRCLGKFPGMTVGALAKTLQLDPGTISVALTRLERRKLVERRKDRRDRRRVLLFLTAGGKALDVPSDGTVESCVEKLLATTDADSLKASSLVLDKLARLLEESTAPDALE